MRNIEILWLSYKIEDALSHYGFYTVESLLEHYSAIKNCAKFRDAQEWGPQIQYTIFLRKPIIMKIIVQM